MSTGSESLPEGEHKMKKKVLILATFASIPRVKRLADSLASSCAVTIFEWDRTGKLRPFEVEAEVRIHRARLKAPIGKSLIFWYPVWFLLIAGFLANRKFDILIPQNFDSLLPVLPIAWLRRIRIIYDIADFYADTNIPTRLSVLKAFVAKLERVCLRRAAKIIIVDESRLAQLGNVDKDKVLNIYNSPVDKYDLLNSTQKYTFKANGVFTIFYGGVISSDRGLFEIARAVHAFEDVRLVVAGYGEKEKEFRSAISRFTNVQFIGRITHERIIEMTHASDCIIALYDPRIPNNIYASPNKLFEAMMCGKPIIASSGTSMSRIVESEKCGIVVGYGDIDGIREAIKKLKDSPQLVESYGKNSRRAYVSKYDWRLMQEKLVVMLN